MSSAKWRQYFLGLNVFRVMTVTFVVVILASLHEHGNEEIEYVVDQTALDVTTFVSSCNFQIYLFNFQYPT